MNCWWIFVISALESTNPPSIWCLEMDWRCFWDSKYPENRSKVEVIRREKVWVYIGSKNRSKISQTDLASWSASPTPLRTPVRTLYSWYKAYSTSPEVVKEAWIRDEDAGRRQRRRERWWQRWFARKRLRTRENAIASPSASNTPFRTPTGFSIFSLADSTKNKNIIMWRTSWTTSRTPVKTLVSNFFFPAPFLLV